MVEENEYHGSTGQSAIYRATKSTPAKSEEQLVETNLTRADTWQSLKNFTQARIALGRVGSSLPTKEILEFGLAHAMARDAVHIALDVGALENKLHEQGLQTFCVSSKATDRSNYLVRPDWGRCLNQKSCVQLQQLKLAPVDFLIVVGDGLSSLAIERNAAPLIAEIQKIIPSHWSFGKIIIASQARVAIADEIAQVMKARIVAILIGERPGLSSPDSLGIYLTFNPKVGCTDADRNCISNVRPEGLNYGDAAKKLMWLAQEALRLGVSGVALKDESEQREKII